MSGSLSVDNGGKGGTPLILSLFGCSSLTSVSSGTILRVPDSLSTQHSITRQSFMMQKLAKEQLDVLAFVILDFNTVSLDLDLALIF
jgi:hypothetical protein